MDEDLEALDRATTLNQGVRRTPVVTIGSDVFVEPTNSAMTAALLAHGLLTREHVAERLHLQNVGDFERVIRVSSGLLVLASQRQAPRALRGLLTLTGAGLVLTGVFGWCPVFHAKGVSSLNGPGDRPDEAERQSWLRPARRDEFDHDQTRTQPHDASVSASNPRRRCLLHPPPSRRPTAPSSSIAHGLNQRSVRRARPARRDPRRAAGVRHPHAVSRSRRASKSRAPAAT